MTPTRDDARRLRLDLWRQPRELEPAFEYGGQQRNLSSSPRRYQQSDLGIDSPDGPSNPLHDHTEAISRLRLPGADYRRAEPVSLILGVSSHRYQIPNSSGLKPAIGLVVVKGVTRLPEPRYE